MITRIELENFKGIRAPVALDLKPITLLFGANSSGKSTVIHALHYALEVLKNHNLDADRTTLGGDSVDLGGFRSLVHAHDFDRRIAMLFEFDVPGTLADYTEGVSDISPAYRGPPRPNIEGPDFDERIVTAWVRFEIGWSVSLGAPQVFSYEVGTNGSREEAVVRIEAGASKGQTASLVLRPGHAIFGEPVLEVSHQHAKGEHFVEESDTTRLLAEAGVETKGGFAILPVYDQESAVPIWRRPLRLWLSDDMTPIAAPLIEVRRILSKLAVGIGELLVSQLERLLYIGPLRQVPPRNYRPPLTENLARWAEGLGAWDALHRRGGPLVSRVSEWIVLLGTGYRLELRQVRELEGNGATKLDELVGGLQLLHDLVREELQGPRKPRRGGVRVRRVPETAPAVFAPAETDEAAEFLRGVPELIEIGLKALRAGRVREELVLVDDRSGVTVHPFDVGVGISQVLPVIVAALYRGERGAGAFVAVEQPELHIHPRLQVALADLFIEQSTTGTLSDHCFLLETHSEHLLLRFLRRVREAAAMRADEEFEGTKGPARKARADTTAAGRSGREGTGGTGEPRGDTGRRAQPGTGGVGGIGGAGRGGIRGTRGAGRTGVPDHGLLTPDHIGVVYVTRGEDGCPRFVPLRIDESGEFLDVWPDGFFDERMKERFA